MNPEHNIYIHVPFCMSKCRYCAFFSRACANPDWDTYTNSILDEIDLWAQKIGPVHVPTVFFGGGTPSLMPVTHFEKIINKIKQQFDLATDAEITLESNPGTIDKNKIHDFISVGVNRISIGVQSLSDEKLRYLGRQHNVADAINAIDLAQKSRARVSADFIYGLPGETVDDVIKTCQQINSLGLQHCSLYELTIEPTTPIGRENPQMPTNDEMADMYNAINTTLALPRYEVSNYATTDEHCLHNENIWDGAPYIGIGRGAAGRIFHNGVWYEQMGANEKFDILDTQSRAIEQVIMGMRTIRGTRLTDDVKRVINMDTVQNMPDLVQIKNNRISVTDAGMLVLDDILVKIVG
ncbi:MAG: radical SAM family heme chaperone HemW [Alphaproteobacteria bacterium]|nr:radical SAM family heme chaperone HemW [Alphaproteobacteria bacterium]